MSGIQVIARQVTDWEWLDALRLTLRSKLPVDEQRAIMKELYDIRHPLRVMTAAELDAGIDGLRDPNPPAKGGE